MIKEAMECEVTEVHTDTVTRLKDTLLSQEQFQNLGTLFKMFSDRSGAFGGWAARCNAKRI